MIFIKRNIYPILLLLVSIIGHWYIFLDWGDLNAGDWVYHYISQSSSLIHFGIYYGAFDFGKVAAFANNWFFYLIYYLLSFIKINWDVGTRILFLGPIFFLTPIFSYIYIRDLFKNNLIAFYSAALYSFNTFFLKLQLDDLTYAFIWWLLPALLINYNRYLYDNRPYRLVINSVLLFIGFVYELRITLLVLAFVTAYQLIFSLYLLRKNESRHRANAIFFCSHFIAIIAQAFWLFPAKFGHLLADVLSNAAPAPFVSFYDLQDVLTLHMYSWSNNYVLEPFIKQPVDAVYFIIPIFAVVGLLALRYSVKKDLDQKYVLAMSAILVISVFLSKQAFAPLGSIYAWLYYHLPLFNLYRESSKFILFDAFGLSILFGIGLFHLQRSVNRVSNALTGTFVSFSILFIVLFFNLQHFVDQKMGYMTKGIAVSNEYLQLESLLVNREKNYFRVSYLPMNSRFGYYSDNHPFVSVTDFVNTLYPLTGFHLFDPGLAINDQLVDVFQHPYSHDIFNVSAIKYVIVPDGDLRQRKLSKDESELVPGMFYDYGGSTNPNIRQWYISKLDSVAWLKRVDVGSKGLPVFENSTYKPPIFVLDDLFRLESAQNLDDKYNFITARLHRDFYFTTSNVISTAPAAKVTDVFEGMSPNSLNITDSSIASSTTLGAKSNNSLYTNIDLAPVYVKLNGDGVSIYRELGTFTMAGPVAVSRKETIARIQVSKTREIYVGIEGGLFELQPSSPLNLGRALLASTTLYTAGSNMVPNGSFEHGLWQQQVGDCNAYDDAGNVGMVLNAAGGSEGANSLQLEATNHVACTYQTFAVLPEDYVFSFDYQSPNASNASFNIGLNDAIRTTISRSMPISDGGWHHYTTKITIPAGATMLGLNLYARSEDGITKIINLYDNVSLRNLKPIANASLESTKSTLAHKDILLRGTSDVSYFDSNYSFKNLLINGSFENGLWNKQVGDCNAYDDTGDIGMRLAKVASDGSNSLELTARRHFACASTSLPIQGGSTYMISFDYQSPNSKVASYYLNFNDASTTLEKGDVIISDNKWRTFSRTITAPRDATGLNIIFSSKETDGSGNVINRYDNVQVVEVPNLQGTYYLVSDPQVHLVEPKSVTFDLINPTKKLVHIRGATTGFFLAFSESFHPQWQLQINNSEIHGWLNGWMPSAKPDRVSDDAHFALDDFLNGWYVDPAALCVAPSGKIKEGCTKNADGSYDLEMVIEFWPQRWFYLGLLISGTTLALCLSYLGFVGVRGLVRRRDPAYRAMLVRARADREAAEAAEAALTRSNLVEETQIHSIRHGISLMHDGLLRAWRQVLRYPLRAVISLVIAAGFGRWFGIEAFGLWTLFLMFLLYRWDSRVTGSMAILTLVACPILLSLYLDDVAEQTAVYAYFFLVMTVALQIAEFRRDQKKAQRVIKTVRPIGAEIKPK